LLDGESLKTRLEANAIYDEITPFVERLVLRCGTTDELRALLAGEMYLRFMSVMGRYKGASHASLEAMVKHDLTNVAWTYSLIYESDRGGDRNQAAL
jgi:hypothetical protein